MKYETLILQSLFVVCLLVCVLTFGAMLSYHAPVVATAAGHALAPALAGSVG